MPWQLNPDFRSGELSPNAYNDTRLSATGAKTLTNAKITAAGDILKRPGSAKIATVIGGYKSRIFPFRPSSGGDYIVQVTSDDASGHKHLTVVTQSGYLDNWADGLAHSPFPDPNNPPVASPGTSPPSGVTSTNSYLHFYSEADLDVLEGFVYDNRLYLLCENQPPAVLEKKSNGRWSWGVAPIPEGTVEVARTTPLPDIVASADPAYPTFKLTASEPLFRKQDENKFFRIGQQANQSGMVAGTNVEHGVWVRLSQYISPTVAQCIVHSRANTTDPFLASDIEWDDWCGPFEVGANATISFVSGQDATTMSQNVNLPDTVDASSAIFTLDMVGTPMFLVGGQNNQLAIITRVVSTTRVEVYSVGFGPISYPFTGQVYPINSTWSGPDRPRLAFIDVAANGNELVTVGVNDIVPSGHEAIFDRFEGTAVGGAILSAGGSFLSTASGGSSIYSAWTYQVRKSPLYLGPTFSYGVGWSKAEGFPTVGTAHQDRVWISGVSGNRRAIYGSETGDPDSFKVGPNASDPIRIDVASSDGAEVRWMASNQDLLFGTDRHEYRVQGSPISGQSLGVERQTGYGAKRVPPVMAGLGTLFVGRDARSLRQAAFEFERSRYVAPDLASQADHLFPSGSSIERLAYSSDRDQVVFALRKNSDSTHDLLSLSTRPEERIHGWSPWELLGADDIEDVVVDGEGRVVLVVQRTINGNAVRYVESVADGQVCDSQVTLTTGVTASQATGLDHLAGETVQLVADGIYIGSFTVSGGGSVSFPGLFTTPPSSLVVGLPITMTLEALVQPTQQRDLSLTSGFTRIIQSGLIQLRASKGLTVDGTAYQTVPASVATQSVPEQDGWVALNGIGNFGRVPTVAITQSVPYDFRVSALNLNVEVDNG